MEKQTKFEFILGMEPDVIEAIAKGPMPEAFAEEQLIAQAIVAAGDNAPPMFFSDVRKPPSAFERVMGMGRTALFFTQRWYSSVPTVKEEQFVLDALIAMGED